MVNAEHASPAREPRLDGQLSSQLAGLAETDDELIPAIPVSAGAMIFDRKGRLLILKPTYKSGWTIPGGVMEADGESPWQACQREVREECGLTVLTGRLACMDFRRPRPGRPGGIRYLFDCGRLDDAELSEIVLQPEEISEFRLVQAGQGAHAAQRSDQAPGARRQRREVRRLPGGRPACRRGRSRPGVAG